MVPRRDLEQNHYRILGIAFQASPGKIKKAYRRLALQTHPDKCPQDDKENARARLQALEAARAVLKDKSARAVYDLRYAAIKADRERREREQRQFVIIRVGQDAFVIHEKYLRKRSAVLQAQIDQCLREVRNLEIDLSEFHKDIVAVYIDFCTSGAINLDLSTSIQRAAQHAKKDSPIYAEHRFLAKLYVFGEKMQDYQFCNKVMACMTAACDKKDEIRINQVYPDKPAIQTIYEGTSPGSPARAFLVDLYTRLGRPGWFTKYEWACHPEFMWELTKALLAERAEPVRGEFRFHEVRMNWYR